MPVFLYVPNINKSQCQVVVKFAEQLNGTKILEINLPKKKNMFYEYFTYFDVRKKIKMN